MARRNKNLNSISNQRNAALNTETEFSIYPNNKNVCWEDTEKGKFHTWIVGVYIGLTFLEIHFVVCGKVNDMNTLWAYNSTSSYVFSRNIYMLKVTCLRLSTAAWLITNRKSNGNNLKYSMIILKSLIQIHNGIVNIV